MIYAHVTSGVVDQIGTPPATAYADGRWWDLRTLDPVALDKAGWVEAIEATRPADTSTQTSDMWWTISGGKATQTWTVRAKTQTELDADTATANATSLREKARTGIAVNDTFLALTSPTNAQTLTQVQRLTRECTALIRLAISALDSTSGT